MAAVGGLALNWKGGTAVVRRLLARYPEVVPKDTGDARHEYEMGRTIGCLERTLVFTLVLFGQWGALGLVIAAEREGGGPLVPLRLRDLGGVGIGERPRVLPGETITHFDMLEPGEWTLWAWSPAFELDALPATVRPGEVTSVELDLRVRR